MGSVRLGTMSEAAHETSEHSMEEEDHCPLPLL